jgi:hypothetical protein
MMKLLFTFLATFDGRRDNFVHGQREGRGEKIDTGMRPLIGKHQKSGCRLTLEKT